LQWRCKYGTRRKGGEKGQAVGGGLAPGSAPVHLIWDICAWPQSPPRASLSRRGVPTARPQQWTTDGQGRTANRQGALFVPKGPWPAAELVRCAAEPLRPRPASQGVSSSRLSTVRPVPAVGGEACVRTRCWGPCHALRPKRPEKNHLIFFYCF
jgi:hypothetical protein